MDNAHHRSQQLQLIPPVHRCRLLFVTLQKYKSRELEIYCETVSHYESVAVGAGGGGETDRSVRVSFHFHSARSHTPVRCVTAQKAKKRKKKGRRKEMDGWQFIHSFIQSVSHYYIHRLIFSRELRHLPWPTDWRSSCHQKGIYMFCWFSCSLYN